MKNDDKSLGEKSYFLSWTHLFLRSDFMPMTTERETTLRCRWTNCESIHTSIAFNHERHGLLISCVKSTLLKAKHQQLLRRILCCELVNYSTELEETGTTVMHSFPSTALVVFFLFFSQIEGESVDSTDLEKEKATNETGGNPHANAMNNATRPAASGERKGNSSEVNFQHLVDKIAHYIGKNQMIQMKCNNETKSCSFSLRVNGSFVESAELDKSAMAIVAALTEGTDEIDPGRGLPSMTYYDSRLGTIEGDEPLMYPFGTLPASDLEVGTKFILEVSRKCAGHRGRKKRKICREIHAIHYNTIRTPFRTLPTCEVLTVTIHGWNAGPMYDIDNPLAIFHAQHYKSPCLLIVDWSKAAHSNGLLVPDYLHPRKALGVEN